MQTKRLILFPLFINLISIFSQGGEILHYTETTAFNHGTASHSSSLFQTIADSLGLGFVDDRDGSDFDTYANLQRFDLVIFSNTSGDRGLDSTQQANFEKYISSGASYLGIHAASDTYRHSSANGSLTGSWDWYAETVCGASVQNSPNHTVQTHTGAMTFIQTGNMLDNQMPNPWTKQDEYYYWENGYQSSDFVTILKVGVTGNQVYDSARMTAHIRELPGGGKAFYTSLGHAASNYNINTDFGKFMENAILWIRTGSALHVDFENRDILENLNARLLNPIDKKITLMLTLDVPRQLVMDVYDLAGKHLYQFKYDAIKGGPFIWENEVKLPGGLYIVSVHSLEKYILSEKLWVK